MANELRRWRKANGLTQVEAAELLAVSQPYLSLIEKGERPLPAVVRARMELPGKRDVAAVSKDIHEDLVALGYPGFAFNKPTRRRPSPGAALLRALPEPDVETRVAEGLPWMVRHYAREIDWTSLVHHAKLMNQQNRLGFTVDLARALPGDAVPGELVKARESLVSSRLLSETTFFWDSMPAAFRKWAREHRIPEAAFWNVASGVKVEDLEHAGPS